MAADLREAFATLTARWWPKNPRLAGSQAALLWGYLGHLDSDSSSTALRRQAQEAARAVTPSPPKITGDELAREIEQTLRSVFYAQRAEDAQAGGEQR